MVLEIKGKIDDKAQVKHDFLDDWGRAINTHGGFGKWTWVVSRHPSDLIRILAKNEKKHGE